VIEVVGTRLAVRQAADLRGPAKRAYEAFLDELASSGCRALGYRVTGSLPLNRLCVKHLRAQDRAIVAFESATKVWVLLVGAHIDDEPERSVYDLLYEVAGVAPEDDEKRTKPPCCGEAGFPPEVEAQMLDDLIERAQILGRTWRF
jgi:hypothetical protein